MKSVRAVSLGVLLLVANAVATAQTSNPLPANIIGGGAQQQQQLTQPGANGWQAAPESDLVFRSQPVGVAQGRLGQTGDAGQQGLDPLAEASLHKLTIFQEFVRDDYGVTPVLFGSELFVDKRRYQPVAGAPVPTDYVIGPGDEVVVYVGGAMEQTMRLTVDRDGRLTLPRVGPVVVAGTRASELDAVLQRRYGEVLRNFSLSTTLGRLRSIEVYVVGQAATPGLHAVSSLSTMVNAVFMAGGPSPTGSMRAIQLRRHDKLVATLDLYQFIRGGDTSKDVHLEPGDVIVIPPAGPRVALVGALDTPTVFELLPSETLRNVLDVVGTPTSLTAHDKVVVDRIQTAPTATPRVVSEIALDSAGLATVLADGDVLRLLPISQAFVNSVTLRGNVSQPLRRAWHNGMTLSELIPDRAALLTRDYFVRRNQAASSSNAVTSPNEIQLIDTGIADLDEPNWDYAIIERLNRETLKTEIVSFNLGRLLSNDPAANLQLQSGDVVTIFGRHDLLLPRAKQSQFVRLEGEVQAPGLYQLHPGETLPQLIVRAGGLSDNAYLFGAEFYRESTRRKQREMLDEAISRSEAQLASRTATVTANQSGGSDAAQLQAEQAAQAAAVRAQLQRMRSMQPTGRIALGLSPQVRELQELPDLPLDDGDRIRVPSRPGFVYAVGAVDNRNALIWQPGRQLSDYLNRVGIDPDADEDNLFVLRADGSVIAAHDKRHFWSSGIDSLELMPGDTLVVPEKVNRETAWTVLVRGLRDWSQILGQFGLAAAAIETLRHN